MIRSEDTEALRRARRRSNTLLLVLAVGLSVFGSAAGALYYVLRPATLRVAVGPAGSTDHKLIEAMAEIFARESKTVRLSPVSAQGAAEALALLTAGKVDLAIGRGDLAMPSEAQILAVVRKNYAVLWTPSGKSIKRKSGRKIKTIADLTGLTVGVIGQTPANTALLRVILAGSGIDADKVAFSQFAPEKITELARDLTLDAFLAVGPLDSQIIAEAIAATARSRGAPHFLAIERSEAIALKHPAYEAEEIPSGVFNANPAWPDDKVDSVSVNDLIITRKSLSEATGAAFFRQLFAVRELIAEQLPGAAHITKPEVEKDTGLPVHRGAAGVMNGTERTFLDRYSDYFWFALLLLSAIGSAAAWFRRYLNRNERDENNSGRNKMMIALDGARIAASEQELLAMQREVEAIIRRTLQAYDEGALEQEELAAFGLVLELFEHAVVERRASLQVGPTEAVAAVPQPHRPASPVIQNRAALRQ
jgi:TRAP transporter TAXI family solute receptor